MEQTGAIGGSQVQIKCHMHSRSKSRLICGVCCIGVLQALSVAYFIVALLSSYFPPRLDGAYHRIKLIRCHVLLGLLPLLILNLSATFLLHVPGCPVGYLGPGGTADGGEHRNCTGGAHLYVDSLLFGRNHLFQTPTCQKLYRTGPYDPEGALNWLMVATTAYLGYFGAAHVTSMESGKRKIQSLLLLGSVLLLLSVASGGILVHHSPWIPLNKNLWSISYVFLSSGIASLLQALLFLVLDESERRVRWSGWPFLGVGKNSIFVYVMVRQLALSQAMVGHFGECADSLTMNPLGVCSMRFARALHRFQLNPWTLAIP